MVKKVRSRVAWLAVMVALMPGISLAQSVSPLADRVPANAWVYLSWSGAKENRGLADSKLRRAAEAVGLEKLLKDEIPALIATTTPGEEGMKNAVGYQTVLSAVQVVYDYPGAVFVVAEKGKPPQPTVYAMIDAGSEQGVKDVLERIATLRVMLTARENSEIQVGQKGNLLYISTGPKPEALPEVTSENSLVSSEVFTSAFARVSGKGLRGGAESSKPPEVVGFLNTSQILEDCAIDPEDMAGRMLDGMGVRAVRSLVFTAGFTSTGEWETLGFMAVPGERKGLLGVFVASQSMSSDLAARVPSNAIGMSTVRADAVKLFDSAVEYISSFMPGARERVPTVLGAASAFTGVKVKEDFLDILGPEWLSYTTAEGNKVVLNKPADAGKFTSSLLLFARSGQRALLMAMPKNRPAGAPHSPSLDIATETVNGVEVTTVKMENMPPEMSAMMPASISWAASNGVVAIGENKADVAAAVVTSPTDGGLVGSSKFTTMTARLGAPANASINYADLPVSSGMALDLLRKSASSMGKLFNGFDPMPVMDRLGKLQPLLTPSGSAVWVDEAGVSFRSITPFPGAELLSVDVASGAVTMVNTASRTKEMQENARAMSNARMIIMACTMYVDNDNSRSFPDDLGTLVLTQPVMLDMFVSPKSGKKVPQDIREGGEQDKALWVTSNSDYIYLGKGLKRGMMNPEEIVVLHENPSLPTGSLAVGFADGHVEMVPKDKLQEKLARSQALREK